MSLRRLCQKVCFGTATCWRRLSSMCGLSSRTDIFSPLNNLSGRCIREKPELIIFDKDGTLVCFNTMWVPWCVNLAQRLTISAGQDLSEDVYNILGYDHLTEKKFRLGLLAENTHFQMRDHVVHMVKEKTGVSDDIAQSMVQLCWRETPEDLQIKPTTDLRQLFENLKRHRVKIAICTSDSRQGTARFLADQHLESFVDMTLCGDDAASKPKPNPHNVLKICKSLGVSPLRTILIGDTPADTIMGRQAEVGITVGVLSGVGKASDLSDADVLFDDVGKCVDHLISNEVVHSKLNKSVGRQFRLFSTSASRSKKDFSHVIVGAGSAGCVLANRLSEDSQNSVLLLECGPSDVGFFGLKSLLWKIHMPAALMYNLCNDKYNWHYHTLPQTNCDNRVMYWPRGRVLGGSSSLNAMVYIRGNAMDLDRWETEGATGWNYQNCLPYFKRAQTHELGGDDYRGGDGPLYVSRDISPNHLHDVFIEAAMEAGYPFTEDVNGFQQEGVSRFDMTIHQGQRWSTASAYLHPALARSNLVTQTGVLVNKVVFNRKKAIGVEVIRHHNGKDVDVERIFAEEVILCGGAINSPQLLMLSGVGPADHLRQLDIEVVADIPGVGKNLQDHLEIYVVNKCKQPITLYSKQKGFSMIAVGLEWFLKRTGAASSTHLESGLFARSRPGVEHPDIMFHFLPSQVIDHGRKSPNLEAYQVHVGPMRPTSRGWIKLNSKSPRHHPLIQPNYLSTEIDRWEMRESIKLAREVFNQPAFDAYRDIELEPGPGVLSDAAIDAFVRSMSDSAYHPSCTCRMGLLDDNETVVDSNTRVVGLENIRVVDASIMPSIVSGNLNAPTIMLAERAADLIRGIPVLRPSTPPVPVFRPDTIETRR